MNKAESDIQKTIKSPVESKADEMKQALKAKKSTKKKKKNHISIEEDKREAKIIARKRKTLEKEETNHL